ncbi:Dehydroquinate synthase-like protein [Peniophora sp. CONT]|nr:Dehydroquinate synthase-like protein [Peniophora sp. CONT]
MATETYRLAVPSERTQEPQPTSKASERTIFNNCYISYGLPFQDAVAKHVEHTFGASRAYILASRTLANTTTALRELQDALQGRVVGVKMGLKAHTSWDDILSMKRDCEEANVDVIITLGGGSLTDAAKLLSLVLANDVNKSADFLTKLDVVKHDALSKPDGFKFTAKPPRVPVICVPTTLSAGEYTFAAGATEDATNKKYQFLSGEAIKLLVLDEALAARTTPSNLWIMSGFRAIDHAVEGYVSPLANAATEEHALAGMKLLIPSLLRARADEHGEDIEARHLGQMGAIEGIAAVFRIYTPCGASHAIGHMLGPFGVGHGETSAILLPAVCIYNAKHGANAERQRALVDALWEVEEVRALGAKAGFEKEVELGVLLRALTRELGLPTSLKEVGVEGEKVHQLAEFSLLDPWLATNPVPLSEKEHVLELLKLVIG